ETVRGAVVVDSKDGLNHQGIVMSVEGSVSLQLSAKNQGVFEAFYNSIKPIPLINLRFEMQAAQKLPGGQTQLPFEIPLKPKNGQELYETYHGVFVNIQYSLRVDVKRSAFSKDLSKAIEFLVQADVPEEPARPVNFTISPASLENVGNRSSVPDFLIEGRLASTAFHIDQPLAGELRVTHCAEPIKSIELQLVRVETCGCREGYAKDPTEIQNIQIAEGDVQRDVAIPIHMIFPRLFTCPTLITDNFKVEFELNVVTVLQRGELITENFPLKLLRWQLPEAVLD
ncbi:uncharacterized protein MONBRDRAFT_14003, partial [Monosiga brevicollis MX1]